MGPKQDVSTNDRVGAIGDTGSGKTFLMLRLLLGITDRNVIIVDTKGTIQLHGYKIVRDMQKAVRGGNVIYRPANRTSPPPEFYYLLWARYGDKKKPALTLYIDEAANVTSSNQIPDGLSLLVTAGREVNVGVWWASQRPTGVHNTLFSQSERIFVFHTTRLSDRKKIAADTNDTALGAADLSMDNHEYFAYGFPKVTGIEAEGRVEVYILRLPSDKEQAKERSNR